jgi:hypothetical protein
MAAAAPAVAACKKHTAQRCLQLLWRRRRRRLCAVVCVLARLAGAGSVRLRRARAAVMIARSQSLPPPRLQPHAQVTKLIALNPGDCRRVRSLALNVEVEVEVLFALAFLPPARR